MRPDQEQRTIAAIGYLLHMIIGNRRPLQRTSQEVIDGPPECALDRVGTHRRPLKINSDYRAVHRAGESPAVRKRCRCEPGAHRFSLLASGLDPYPKHYRA